MDPLIKAYLEVYGVGDSLDKENQIPELKKEEIEYVINTLVSEGFAVDYDGAKCILETMGDEWLNYILQEAPFDVYRGSTEYGGMRAGENEPVKVNKKPYKTKKAHKEQQIKKMKIMARVFTV